jgi:hypothetical protein
MVLTYPIEIMVPIIEAALTKSAIFLSRVSIALRPGRACPVARTV